MLLPHFDLPLRFVGGSAVVNEQDSAQDIASCALAVLSCPAGFRVERPEFGVPDPTFTQGAPTADAFARALQRWEPRADAAVTVTADIDNPFAFTIEAQVAPQTED